MTDESETSKAMQDAILHGMGVVVNRKRVPVADLYTDPAPYVCKHGCERDVLKDRIEKLERFKSLHAQCDQIALDIENKLVDQLASAHKRIEKLEKALREIANMDTDPEFGTPPLASAQKIARAALGEKKDG